MSRPIVVERALAIRQPFAWAVCAEIKTIENRTKGTPYRGWIAIHASQADQPLTDMARQWPPGSPLHGVSFDRGVLIGVARLADVGPMTPDLEDNALATGPVCWRLEEGRLFDEPIPLKGKLNLFKLTAAATAQIAEQLARPAREVSEQVRQAFAAAIAPDEVEQVSLRAQAYAINGCWNDALRCGIRWAALDDANPTAHRLIGFANYNQGQPDEAEAACRRAIERDDQDGYAWLCLGDIYFDRGDVDQASECYFHAEECGIEVGLVEDEGDLDDESVE